MTGWIQLSWRGLAFTVVVLPSASLLSLIHSRADAFFVGWFRPMGITAVFYATLAVHETGSRQVWQITATPFTKLYGERTGRRNSSEG